MRMLNGASPPVPLKSRFSPPTITKSVGVLALALFAIFLGLLAAVFPVSYTIRIAIILSTAVIFLAALSIPVAKPAPDSFLRGLTYALLVVGIVWPVYLTYKFGPTPGLSPTRLLYWSLVLIWFFWFVASRSLRSALWSRLKSVGPFGAILVIYLLWMVICAIASGQIFSLYYTVKLMLGPVLLFLIVLTCFRGRPDVERALFYMVLAAIISSCIGIAETVHKANFFAGLLQVDPDAIATMEWAVSDRSREGAYRAASTFTHPLAFGEYLSMILPLAVYQLIYGGTALKRFLALVALPLIAVGIYITHTRSSLIASGAVVILVLIFLGIRMARQRKSFTITIMGVFTLVSVILVAVAALIGASEMVSGRSAAEAGSSNVRLLMLDRGSHLIAEAPILGYGPGLGGITLGFLPGVSKLTLDSYFLSVALETGIPGLLLFLGLVTIPIVKGFVFSLRKSSRENLLAFLLATSLLAFVIVKTVLSLTNNFDSAFVLIALSAVTLLQGNDISDEGKMQ